MPLLVSAQLLKIVLFFCHDLKRTNGNKIAVDVATIAVCANCVERLMPLIFATRQTNATSAEITPAKGAFVANVKPEHGEQRALKTFSRQVATRQTKRNVPHTEFHLPNVLLWQM